MNYPETFDPGPFYSLWYQYDKTRPEVYYQANKVTQLEKNRQFFEVMFGRLVLGDNYPDEQDDLTDILEIRWDYNDPRPKQELIAHTYRLFLNSLAHTPSQYHAYPRPNSKDPDPFLDELEQLTYNADHGLER